MTGILIGLAMAVVLGLLVAEVKGGLFAVAVRIVHMAARRLPRDGERWREEWLSDLATKADRPLTALCRACALYLDAGRMRSDLLPRSALTLPAQRLKRAVDLLVACLILLIFAPTLVLIAIWIKLSSPGPIFYRQARRGRNGCVIHLLKFRTVRTHPAVDDATLLTPLGLSLRRLGLDELPQLFNVLRGEMTLVGPRPMTEAEATVLDDALPDRPDLTPGLTGPSQLTGWNTFPELLEHECRYIEGWSLWRDIKILLAAIPAALSDRRRRREYVAREATRRSGGSE